MRTTACQGQRRTTWGGLGSPTQRGQRHTAQGYVSITGGLCGHLSTTTPGQGGAAPHRALPQRMGGGGPEEAGGRQLPGASEAGRGSSPVNARSEKQSGSNPRTRGLKAGRAEEGTETPRVCNQAVAKLRLCVCLSVVNLTQIRLAWNPARGDRALGSSGSISGDISTLCTTKQQPQITLNHQHIQGPKCSSAGNRAARGSPQHATQCSWDCSPSAQAESDLCHTLHVAPEIGACLHTA